jgi:hypothetical protein
MFLGVLASRASEVPGGLSALANLIDQGNKLAAVVKGDAKPLDCGG